MVCGILKYGYELPFYTPLSSVEFNNSFSAFENSEFVDESSEKMLGAGTIKESLTKPKVINPLSASTKEKHRLILDLREVNSHLYKDKIKFDDSMKSFQNHPEGSKGYSFKFNLKSGYYHINIFNDHQTFLGCSCEISRKTRCFTFTVPPFGPSTAPF